MGFVCRDAFVCRCGRYAGFSDDPWGRSRIRAVRATSRLRRRCPAAGFPAPARRTGPHRSRLKNQFSDGLKGGIESVPVNLEIYAGYGCLEGTQPVFLGCAG